MIDPWVAVVSLMFWFEEVAVLVCVLCRLDIQLRLSVH